MTPEAVDTVLELDDGEESDFSREGLVKKYGLGKKSTRCVRGYVSECHRVIGISWDLLYL